MTTMHLRHAQHARGKSQQAEFFAPPPRARQRGDWLTWLLLAGAVLVLLGLFAISEAQRERFERELQAEADSHTLRATAQAEFAGFERAVAALSPAVQAAWKAGLVEGQRAACRGMQ